ncbi:hypothetical protein WMY93_013183 [Mugilogobius chulae]|uniref:Uncharacterized protein n=1 Tax=Mugilogobius chulae TaxID=88201 RepID=A0AAW0P3A7_9GOBI
MYHSSDSRELRPAEDAAGCHGDGDGAGCHGDCDGPGGGEVRPDPVPPGEREHGGGELRREDRSAHHGLRRPLLPPVPVPNLDEFTQSRNYELGPHFSSCSEVGPGLHGLHRRSGTGGVRGDWHYEELLIQDCPMPVAFLRARSCSCGLCSTQQTDCEPFSRDLPPAWPSELTSINKYEQTGIGLCFQEGYRLEQCFSVRGKLSSAFDPSFNASGASPQEQ